MKYSGRFRQSLELPVVRMKALWSLLILGLAATAAAAEEGPAHHLQGYGRIAFQSGTADAQPARFECDDETTADRLLSKLWADFSWDRVAGPEPQSLGDGAPALKLASHGLLSFARQGKTVVVLAGESPAAVDRQRAGLGLDRNPATFAPQRRHPLALDFFDLRAVSLYYQPLNVLDLAKGLERYSAAALAQTTAFWRPFGYGHSFFGPYFGLDELADGAAHFFPHRRMIEQAAAVDAVVMSHWGQYEAPWWMRNRFARDVVQWDPHAISGWNGLAAMAGTHLSQQASAEAHAYTARFARDALVAMNRAAGDRLGCFREVGGGHPGDELAWHHASTELMDYDEPGQTAFRRWLRETRGGDLAALGRRWFGDPQRYRSWDDVRLPSHFEFFGGFGQDTLNLLTSWSWRPDNPLSETEGWYRPDYRVDDAWTPTDLAPSMKQLFLFGSQADAQLRQGKSTVAWLRREFDPTTWLAARPAAEVYCVAQVGDKRTEPVEVWLNGDYLGPLQPRDVSAGPIAFRVTKLLRPGRNVLCLKLKSGLVRGPVFLTRREPRRYPHLGPQENARWVDLRDWMAEKLVLGWRRAAGEARQAAPDLPLLFCPGSTLAMADQFLGLKRELGIEAVHFTGGGSSYMPWWPGLGYVWGAYGTSEEGGTIDDPRGLDKELAWMLLNGQGHHNFYYSAIHYMRLEEKDGWFTRNRRLLELIGKANWARPEIAVFRSAASQRYLPESQSPQDGDIGRGALQAAHFANVYVSEAEIRAGLIGDYPMVFDAGNRVIDDATLAALEAYVRRGGTLVAAENTGRHTLLEPDRWPIARLTGLRVVGRREGARLSIPSPCAALPHLAGRSFRGDGLALEADPASGDAPQVLARWSDGALAATLRRLGKGQVIQLGSAVWQSGSTRTDDGPPLPQSVQTTFLSDLFAAVGVRRQVEVDSEDVWTRRLITKNGLQHWAVAFNAGRAPVSDLTLRLPWAEKPQRVVDVASGKPVDFQWEQGEVRVGGLALPPRAVRVLGVDTAQPQAAVAHWFAEKCRYEERPATGASRPAAEQPPAPPATAVTFREFRVRPGADDAAANAGWLDEPTDRPPWKPLGYGFWDELGLPARGVALYRQTFTVPEAWRGRRVLLACMSFDYPVFLEKAEFFVNGQPAGEYRGHAWANFDVLDITPHVVPGENRVAVRVTAEQVRGGYLGQLVIYPLEQLDDARPLRDGWKLFADNRQSRPTTLPLRASGRHLETDVALPAAWKERDIFLEFEVADRWVGLVVVNGRPIGYNQSLHPYPNIMQVNLYPWAKAGRINRIELWPRTPEDTPAAKITVQQVRIGTVGPPRPPEPLERWPVVLPEEPRESLAIDNPMSRAAPAPSTPASLPPGERGEKQRSHIANGGFEQWSPLPPPRRRDALVQHVELGPDFLAPDFWTPGREVSGNARRTGKVSLDKEVQHSGQSSARLENADPRDITVLQYSTERGPAQQPAAIRPNRRYIVRWWVKGERVEKGDSGPILMLNVISTAGGRTYRTFTSQRTPLPDGTFDWQPQQLAFITDAAAQSVIFSFQLRWATGTIWYDDVELEDAGAVVPVETY